LRREREGGGEERERDIIFVVRVLVTRDGEVCQVNIVVKSTQYETESCLPRLIDMLSGTDHDKALASLDQSAGLGNSVTYKAAEQAVKGTHDKVWGLPILPL
jgi:hypothetical protein